jgi:GH24 family phage-related lysozyme (muramidase)
MKQAVIDNFLTWTERFESFTTWFYLDIKGLVTIGFGNLVDPFATTAGLSFVNADGTPASPAQVQGAWQAVKRLQGLAPEGGGTFARFTTVRATRDSINALCQGKLALIDKHVRAYFPEWDDFPADGQLLVCSMCWAMGDGAFAHWPHFVAAVNAGDWLAVATPHGTPASCQMSEVGQNASFKQRNAANLALATSAHFAALNGTGDCLT